jgi:hypothetical protein
MDIDIRDELDRSFGAGPPVDDLAVVLDRGHRAVRRRRITVAAGAAVCCVVVGGAAWSTVDSSGPTTGRDPVVQPSGTGTGQEAGSLPVEYRKADDPDLGKGLVGFGDDGVFLVREGVDILEYVDNPLGLRPPDYSAGFAIRTDRREVWVLAEGNPSGGGTYTAPARESFPSLAMWIDDWVALQDGEATLALVSFGGGDRLVPEPGVEIVRQQADPDLGPAFAGPDALRTAVAEVRWQGERWYVLARELPDSDPEYFPTAASVSRPTLEGFLDYARTSYESGTGLR